VIVPHASSEPRPAVGCKVRLSVEPRQIIVTDGTSNSLLANNKLHSTSIPLPDLHTISCCLHVLLHLLRAGREPTRSTLILLCQCLWTSIRIAG
jgi:hypothetical protein